ncbi:MAG: hypothetical protein IPP74_14690 [Alphaproteobacteria bacterium]|nr:hypothetical protein [Alphaproteobacteria bacterium]
MFSNRIAGSAKFLQMPSEAQLLYFHMVLRADDDGVVESYPLMKLLGSPSDVFKVLVAKGFVRQLNEDQVIVITDWLEHNTIRADRKIDSIYKNLLVEVAPDIPLIEAKPRSDVEDNSRRLGGQSTDGLSQVKLGQFAELRSDGEYKIEKDVDEKPSKTDNRVNDKLAVFRLFGEEKKPWWIHKQQKVDALALFDSYNLDQLKKAVSIARDNRDDQFCPKINTPSDLARRMESLLDYKERNRIS